MFEWVGLHGTILKILDLMCERYGILNNFFIENSIKIYKL
jgi:hypothetical protein